jgi:hypothetical protein
VRLVRDVRLAGIQVNSDSTDSSNGHFEYFGHFVALPNTGENKWGENNKNRENKKDVLTGGGEEVPKMSQMPKGRIITRVADLPATACQIGARCSSATAARLRRPRCDSSARPG